MDAGKNKIIFRGAQNINVWNFCSSDCPGDRFEWNANQVGVVPYRIVNDNTGIKFYMIKKSHIEISMIQYITF